MPLTLNGSGAVTGLASVAGALAWSSATLRADGAEVDTSQGTSSTSYTDLATPGPAVTVATGTRALVILTCRSYHSALGNDVFMSFAVSGASTVAATDGRAAYQNAPAAGAPLTVTMAVVVTGLTAGSNTFTAKYRTSAATATFSYRKITVIDLGS